MQPEVEGPNPRPRELLVSRPGLQYVFHLLTHNHLVLTSGSDLNPRVEVPTSGQSRTPSEESGPGSALGPGTACWGD